MRNVNLIVEQGNTSTKVAFYDQGQLQESFMFKRFTLADLIPLVEKFTPHLGILSTVLEQDMELISWLKENLKYFILLDEYTSIPIKIDYKTPDTLGKDRLAAVVGAWYEQPGRDVLIIDAGTAITYEFLDAYGVYHGGNISPGMTTRFKALNTFTGKLPLVFETEETPFLGTDTISAIQAGVVNGILYEIDGYINDMREKYPGLFVFLTGGHSFYFERRLKNSIFADINLVMSGMNRILEWNVEN